MRTFGRIIGRLIAIALSYVIACVAAGIMVASSYVLQAYMAGPVDISQGRLFAETLYVSGLVAAFVSVYAFTPAILAAVVAEIFAIRRALYYAICGAIAGLIGYAAFNGVGDGQVPDLDRDYLMVAGAGIGAGFVYWFLGGRSAGVLERPAA